MTRTVALGSVTDEMRKVYNTVLEAQLAGISAARAGIIGRDMDKAARELIEKAGYGEYFGHPLGHSVGLLIHEAPNASPKEERPLPEGAVVTCEPGIYIPGKFGVRIEDMLYIMKDGAENLTKAPNNLIIL
jgi:Xaa-Pro aminopeptidase